MIITKTPFRMSFFGGGTDLESFYEKHGGAILSTTFDKYCYVNIRELPPFFNYSNEIVYSKIERTNSVDDINHPLVKNTLLLEDISNLRISYESDLPARSGLGTSSSFAVGLINAVRAFKGLESKKRRLADEAIYIERILCNEAGGIQDQIAASFGGFNRINIKKDGSYEVKPIKINKERKDKLENNLMLFFTGFTRFSSDIQEENLAKTDPDIREMNLIRTLELVDKAEKILVDDDSNLDLFGELMDEAWKLKRGTGSGISTQAIDKLYEIGKQAGALGGKLLGAGGGGFLLFYVNPDNQDSVKNALKNLLYVPFHFESDGSRILYDSNIRGV